MFQCRARRPKYPSKSPIFLGSWQVMTPFYTFSMLGMLGSKDRLQLGSWATAIPNTQQGGEGSPFSCLKKLQKLSHTLRLTVYFLTGPFSSTNGTWASVKMRSNGCTMCRDGSYPPANWCPSSCPVMLLPHWTAPEFAPLAWPSWLSACLAAPMTPAISSSPGSYPPTTLLQSPLTILLSCYHPLPPVGGSTMHPLSLKQPSEHSPCCSVTFRSMGRESTSTAWPTIPSEGAPQTGCPTSLAWPTTPARAMTQRCQFHLSHHLQLDRWNTLPPTLHCGGGWVPPWRHPVLWTKSSSILHTPCLGPCDFFMQIYGWMMHSTLSPSSSSVGIKDTSFVDTLHGKPSNTLQPHCAVLETMHLAGPPVPTASQGMLEAPTPVFLVPWYFSICHVGTGKSSSTSYPDQHIIRP